MQHLEWQTFQTGRVYHAESHIGVGVHVAMRRERGKDKGFVLSIGNETHVTQIKSPERAMQRAEMLYCRIVHNEWERVCK